MLPGVRKVEPENEKRRAGRVRCSLTTCQFGEVVNISRTGLRVQSRRPIRPLPPGASVNLKIKSAGCMMVVTARPVHVRPRSDGMFDVGFQFVGVPEERAKDLMDLARIAFDGTRVVSFKAS